MKVMNFINRIRFWQCCAIWVMALSSSLSSTLAYADYSCKSKELDPTPQQKEMFARGAAAMRAALLPPPEGWRMQDPSYRTPSGKFCPDFKNDPVKFDASVLYIIMPTLEQRRQQRAADVTMRRELDELNTLPPGLQAQVTAFDTENAAFNKERREAERAKDSDLAKAKSAQAQDASRKAYKIRDDHSTSIQLKQRAIYTKFEKALKQDQELAFRVTLEANGTANKSDANNERMLFGPANIKTNQATDKLVRIISAIKRNEDATAEQFAVVNGLIDRAKLQGLVAGNLPSMEDSKALFAKQDEIIAQQRIKSIEQQKLADAERQSEQAAARAIKQKAAAANTQSTP